MPSQDLCLKSLILENMVKNKNSDSWYKLNGLVILHCGPSEYSTWPIFLEGR